MNYYIPVKFSILIYTINRYYLVRYSYNKKYYIHFFKKNIFYF